MGTKFQELFSLMKTREEDLKGMMKFEDDFNDLDDLEISELENLMGMCQDFDSQLQEVMGKRCHAYRKLHGIS